MFYWYHANGDGTADRIEDSPEVCKIIDSGGRGWFGNPEGAIIHGGVIASAFTRNSEPTYDAVQWFKTGEMVFAGYRVTVQVTASRANELAR